MGGVGGEQSRSGWVPKEVSIDTEAANGKERESKVKEGVERLYCTRSNLVPDKNDRHDLERVCGGVSYAVTPSLRYTLD